MKSLKLVPFPQTLGILQLKKVLEDLLSDVTRQGGCDNSLNFYLRPEVMQLDFK